MLELKVLEQLQGFNQAGKDPTAIVLVSPSPLQLERLCSDVLAIYNIDRGMADIDVHFYKLEEGEKTLGVELAREIASVMGRQPLRRGRRTIVVENAEVLTVGAANALLKPVEDLKLQRVIFTATTLKDWPSPLLSRFMIYELHQPPTIGDVSFTQILRVRSEEDGQFWDVHEDSLYEVLEVIWGLRTKPPHQIIQTIRSVQVLEENPALFMQGVVLGLLHTNLFLDRGVSWIMPDHYQSHAESFGANFKKEARQKLMDALLTLQEWVCGSSPMGSAQTHLLALILHALY